MLEVIRKFDKKEFEKLSIEDLQKIIVKCPFLDKKFKIPEHSKEIIKKL